MTYLSGEMIGICIRRPLFKDRVILLMSNVFLNEHPTGVIIR